MQHVCRRAGTFHFRRRVPGRLRDRLGGKAEIYRSLETSSPREAGIRSRLLFLESERLFAALEHDPALPVDAARRLMRDLVGPAAWVHADLVLRRPFGQVLSPPQTVPVPGLVQAAMPSGAELALDMTACEDTAGPSSPSPEAYRMAELFEPSAASGPPSTVPSGDARAKPMGAGASGEPPSDAPMFGALTETHIEQMVGTGAWSAQQTALQNRATFRLWIEFHGDRPVDRYSRRDASSFMGALRKLPRMHGRSPSLKGTMRENIELATRMAQRGGKQLPLLAMKTIKRHMSALHGYWDWLRQHGHHEFVANPFAGFDYPEGKPASELRSMWSDADLKRLFGSRLWVGPEVDRRSAAFWLPIIGLLTGMRLEEIAQLHTADIRKRDGIDFFLVHAEDERRTKNANSVREVPIPGGLIALGFMTLVAERRRTNSKRLWPDLSGQGPDRRLGAYYTRRFTEYRREIGIYKPGVDFHSFRGTFETLILNAGANPVFVKAIMGHSTSDLIGEGSRYLKHVTLKNKLEAMNMLKLGVDLGYLLPNA
nr:site-specific integrase [Azospirillum sp. 412522]